MKAKITLFVSTLLLFFLGAQITPKAKADSTLTTKPEENSSYPYYYKDYECCSTYYPGCYGPQVYKCRLIGTESCYIPGQIPCEEICGGC